MSHSGELFTLLKENHVYELFYTHVSLIHPKGKYSLSRSVLTRFWDLYSKLIQSDEVTLGIAEMPQMHSSVIVDVDLKFFIDYAPPEGSLYPLAFVTALIQIYQNVLRTVVRGIQPEQLLCVLLEKPKYAMPDQDNHYKNGFHLHFPNLFLSRVDQEIVVTPRVREEMASNRYEILDHFQTFAKELVNVSNITDLIDTAAFKNPWLLYGSRKSEQQDTYRITHVYRHDLSECSVVEAFLSYTVYDEEEERIDLTPSNIEFHLPRILSICPYGRSTSEVSDQIRNSPDLLKYVKQTKITTPPDDTRDDEEVEADLENARKILSFLSTNRADDRNNWMTVGWALFNISRGAETGLDLWMDFSRRSAKFNQARCLYEWTHMEDRKRITLGTLRFFAKTDSPEDYRRYIYEQNRSKLSKDFSNCHYDLAVQLHRQHGNEFVYCDAGWYSFNNHHWECIDSGVEIRSKISNDLVAFYTAYRDDIFNREYHEKDEKSYKDLERRKESVSRLIDCLKTSQFKQSIMKECQEVFYVRGFERKLNTNRYLIGFRNGVYDLEANYFRIGLPTDYISIQMPIEYKEFTHSHPLVLEVHNFLEKVFPDSSIRRYFMDVMSETFVGYNHRKHVYFWTGVGDNGKSITQMFFEQMFGRLSIKAPMSLITSRRPNAGAANAELARTGEGVRTLFLDEPDPDEEIFTGVFKQLSGNDSIYTRDLYQSGKSVNELVPMFKLFVICNKLPKIRKGGDKATWNRIRVIPFESKFEKNAPLTPEEQLRAKVFPKDTNFAQKIPSLIQPFCWVLLQHRTQPKIDEPEKVLTATHRYRMNNDYLHQYISQMIVDDEKGMVSATDLYCKYKDWLEEGLPGIRPPPLLEFTEYFQEKWGNQSPDGFWKGRRFKFEQGKGNLNEAAALL